MYRVLIGTDPELFLIRDKKFNSAHGIIPGTKDEPFEIERGAVQVDGMALEFNINPVDTENEFLISIDTVLGRLREMVPEEYEFSITPTAHFDEQHMEEQPEEAKVLGCDPDFNAYTGAANAPPDQHPTMRTASGHIHIGWTKDTNPMGRKHFERCCILAQQLDYYLGIPSVLLDNDRQRRLMYGQAGCFRPKSYGMEYRTLSNFWLKEERLRRWVYNNTTLAFESLAYHHRNIPREMKSFPMYAANIINYNDRSEASYAIPCFRIPIPIGCR